MKRYKPLLKIKNEYKHSKEFLKILKEATPEKAIRAITHKEPLLVFWVSPDGDVIDAKNAHFDNPPDNDKSILSHKTHKGYLRGRSAMIEDVIYIVIYSNEKYELSNYQEALLKKFYSKILKEITNKYTNKNMLNNAIFIKENGKTINV
jgi:hypothetical protein